jgi:hypothetical protein
MIAWPNNETLYPLVLLDLLSKPGVLAIPASDSTRMSGDPIKLRTA